MIKYIEHFFWAMLWVFLLIITGLAILHWIQRVNGSGVFGGAASWITGAVTP